MANVPDDTQLVYANWARVNGTPFEVALDLGYNDEEGPPDRYPVKVVMSWEHLKALVHLLDRNVRDYEAQAGPIRKMYLEDKADDDD